MEVRLKRIRGAAVGPEKFVFSQSVKIGSKRDLVDMFIEHPDIEPVHCRIEIATEAEMAELRETGYRGGPLITCLAEESRKGTFVNGHLLHDYDGHVRYARVVDGDVISLARLVTYEVGVQA